MAAAARSGSEDYSAQPDSGKALAAPVTRPKTIY